jgi:DUF4097 and DUF4098 domain-containing protein YvlB
MKSKVAVTPPAVAAALLLAASMAASADDRTFDRTVAAEQGGTIEISNVAGSINVIGWDRAEVQVHAVMEEGVERVDVNTTPGRTIVKVVLPNMSWHGGEASLDVHVPKNSEVNATAVSADLTTSQLTGRQRLQTVSGELRADVGGDRFEGKTVSGDMRLRGNSKPSEMRLSSVSGSITLDRGAGDVDASSISGDVRLEVNPASSIRLHSTSGDLVFSGSIANDATVEAETVSGDVTLRSKAPQGFEYEASSFSGDIESCFGKEAEKVSTHGPGTRLNGSLGDGKARMRAKSMSGDIELCDR